jgi:hypothetical protein
MKAHAFRRSPGLLALAFLTLALGAGCTHPTDASRPSVKHVLADLDAGMTETDVSSLLGQAESASSTDAPEGHVDVWTYSYATLAQRIEGTRGELRGDLVQTAGSAGGDRTVTVTFVNGALSQVTGR